MHEGRSESLKCAHSLEDSDYLLIGDFMFEVLLKANETEYKSQGDTIFQALENIPLRYNELKTKGTLWITRGQATIERFFPFLILRILLGGKIRKQGYAKQFEMMLKDKEKENVG